MSGSDAASYAVEVVPDELADERLDRMVALITGCSRAEAVESIRAGSVLVDGVSSTKPSVRVHAGAEVSIAADPVAAPEVVEPDASVEVRVVYSDDDIIVIDKQPGLVVHPGAGHRESTLVHGLLAQFPELRDVGEPLRPGLVHRLDRGTSGLLVVARTQDAYTDLVEQLSDHSVERVYTAMTWRHFEHPNGVIDAPIGRSRRDPLRMTVAADGRDSRTHYRVEEEFQEPIAASLVTCELETGRTHQIRVHLASIGHAVLGDEIYGGLRHSFRMSRPFLHARQLSFRHPGTGDHVTFDSPLPGDLQHVLDRFR